ncbi:MAG: thiamine pyrophosphate-dependent enzyme [Alphaproteobacteria bacterium]|jgi:thiamine pyrophosphate-dependent acetolactate synthase large subunit-like protein|nr:aldehyde dehydrogenase [Pseudomonadota bacterium]MCZ6467709.1 thiamine pyrophosphate-dependent enzyme [Alphaproteobacteria bacterium]
MRSERYPLRRRRVVESLLADRGDLLVVAGLGAPCWDVTAAGDHALTFPLWGAMGSAALIGLGLALAQPARRILVITGDGEMLMGLGGLATVAVQAPENLAIAVLDNERYGETGMQATHTAFGVDLAAVAAAAGLPVTGTVGDDAGLGAAVAELRGAQGPVFFAIKVRAEDMPLVLPPRDGVHLKNRFRRALLGEKEGV